MTDVTLNGINLGKYDDTTKIPLTDLLSSPNPSSNPAKLNDNTQIQIGDKACTSFGVADSKTNCALFKSSFDGVPDLTVNNTITFKIKNVLPNVSKNVDTYTQINHAFMVSIDNYINQNYVLSPGVNKNVDIVTEDDNSYTLSFTLVNNIIPRNIVLFNNSSYEITGMPKLKVYANGDDSSTAVWINDPTDTSSDPFTMNDNRYYIDEYSKSGYPLRITCVTENYIKYIFIDKNAIGNKCGIKNKNTNKKYVFLWIKNTLSYHDTDDMPQKYPTNYLLNSKLCPSQHNPGGGNNITGCQINPTLMHSFSYNETTDVALNNYDTNKLVPATTYTTIPTTTISIKYNSNEVSADDGINISYIAIYKIASLKKYYGITQYTISSTSYPPQKMQNLQKVDLTCVFNDNIKYSATTQLANSDIEYIYPIQIGAVRVYWKFDGINYSWQSFKSSNISLNSINSKLISDDQVWQLVSYTYTNDGTKLGKTVRSDWYLNRLMMQNEFSQTESIYNNFNKIKQSWVRIAILDKTSCTTFPCSDINISHATKLSSIIPSDYSLDLCDWANRGLIVDATSTDKTTYGDYSNLWIQSDMKQMKVESIVHVDPIYTKSS